jgi:hypothetical protein
MQLALPLRPCARILNRPMGEDARAAVFQVLLSREIRLRPEERGPWQLYHVPAPQSGGLGRIPRLLDFDALILDAAPGDTLPAEGWLVLVVPKELQPELFVSLVRAPFGRGALRLASVLCPRGMKAGRLQQHTLEVP